MSFKGGKRETYQGRKKQTYAMTNVCGGAGYWLPRGRRGKPTLGASLTKRR